MLKAHLSPDTDAASYKPTKIQAICETIFKAAGLKAGDSLVDLGCGPGLYCHVLASKGLKATGVDWSENSIAYARNLCKGQEASFLHQSYLEPFGQTAFDASCMISQDYGVLSLEQRKTLLGNIRAALKPGGCFALDVPSLAAYEQKQKETAPTWETAERGFWRPHPYLALHTTYFYPEISTLCDIHAVLDDGMTVCRVWQTFFSPDTIRQELADGGFAVKAVWSSLQGDAWKEESPLLGILCQKI